jgi:hypothetical protein
MSPLHELEDVLLVKYLLGSALPEAEVERLEQKYFSDDRYFDHLSQLEDELIDDYLRGALTAGDRDGFERHFLISQRRKARLETRRAVVQFFRRSAGRRSILAAVRLFFRSMTPWARLVVAAAGVVTVVSLAGFAVVAAHLTKEGALLRARIAVLESPTAPSPIASFLLTPGLLKSAEGRRVKIAPAAEGVLLRLALDRDSDRYVTYDTALRTAGGDELWTQRKLIGKNEGNATTVEVLLPAALLTPNDYVIAIWGSERDGVRQALSSYVFRVER